MKYMLEAVARQIAISHELHWLCVIFFIMLVIKLLELCIDVGVENLYFVHMRFCLKFLVWFHRQKVGKFIRHTVKSEVLTVSKKVVLRYCEEF